MNKNYYIRDNDPERLKTLAEEYQSMGRETKIDGNTLTVYATKQPKAPSKKKFAKKPRRKD